MLGSFTEIPISYRNFSSQAYIFLHDLSGQCMFRCGEIIIKPVLSRFLSAFKFQFCFQVSAFLCVLSVRSGKSNNIEAIVILIWSSRSDVADSKGGFAQSGPLCPFARVCVSPLSFPLLPSLSLFISLLLSGNLVQERRSAPGAASTVSTCVSLCRDSTCKYDESNFQQASVL